jgi:23S rRNA (uracil1939-C5)-methyltransferase
MEQNRGPAGRSTRLEVEIEKLVYGGDGLARREGKVVFVPFTAPGDRLEICVAEQKKSLVRGLPVRVLVPGPERIDPACRHFGSCGGCQWQHLRYAFQVETKRRILEESFHHRFPETRERVISMRASAPPYGYRSRARIQLQGVGAHALAGFFRYRSHVVEDIDFCPLFMPPLNAALEHVRTLQREGQLGSEISEMEIACATSGRWTCSAADAATSPAQNGDQEHLTKHAGGFAYNTLASAFFQANEFMLDALIEEVMQQVTGTGSVLDLFSGGGFFSLPLARRFQHVVAVESSPVAHGLCVGNALRAGLNNIRSICADVLTWMKAVGSVAAPGFDLVLLDPPRSGAGVEVMKSLAAWAPETILYVSCDHQTLLRDLAALPARDYRIESVTGLDLFPQTCHFETIVGLRRR